MTILNVEISQIGNVFNVTTFQNNGMAVDTDTKAFSTFEDATRYAKEIMDGNN